MERGRVQTEENRNYSEAPRDVHDSISSPIVCRMRPDALSDRIRVAMFARRCSLLISVLRLSFEIPEEMVHPPDTDAK